MPVLNDPFHITGPAVVSFSGGRTSGYMLWRILQAYGGTLPPDVVVCFANTGREMPGTLNFVRDCGAAWNVNVHWLEYRRDQDSGRVWAELVSHRTASREGEPFLAMIAAKKMLPNPVMRFCTQELKIKTSARFVRDVFGWDHWTTAVGLRADEPKRVEKAIARGKTGKDRHRPLCPLADAGIQEVDVFQFWRAQPFDLRLAGRWEGNCDGCFLKNRGAISRMCRDYPERMQWWAAVEAESPGSTINPDIRLFRADRENYAAMLRITRDQGVLDFDLEDSIPCDAAGCGV